MYCRSGAPKSPTGTLTLERVTAMTEIFKLTIRVQGENVLDATEGELTRVLRGLLDVLQVLAPIPSGDERLVGHRLIVRNDNLPRREITWELLGHFETAKAAHDAARVLLAVASIVTNPITASGQAVLYSIPTDGIDRSACVAAGKHLYGVESHDADHCLPELAAAARGANA